MRWAFVAVMAVHALVHLMGFAKGFGLAKIPQLKHPISVPVGLVWLGAAVLVVGSLVALIVWPKWWWALAGVAVVVSQVAIATSWSDAKFGTVLPRDEAEGWVDRVVDDGQVQAVALGNAGPIVDAGTAERSDTQPELGLANQLQVEHTLQVVDVSGDVVTQVRRRCAQGLRVRDSPDPLETGLE